MISMHMSFRAFSLRRNVEINALIPRGTDEHAGGLGDGQPFKTLYLLNGYGGNCDDWLLNTRISLYAKQHNMAVIMPSGENSFYLNNDDIHAGYTEFVGKELVEMTRALFPLSRRREDTLIGGLSMGGYGAMHTGLAFPETFGSIIALSSALIQNTVITMPEDFSNRFADYCYYRTVFGEPSRLAESDRNPEVLARRLKQENAAIPNIYMACGTEDFLIKENRAFHQLLNDLDIDHEYAEGPGVHDFDFWDAYIRKALDWYAREES